MIFVFYLLAALLVWLSFKSFRGGIAYLSFFRAELAKPASLFTPFVSVIAPCRGLDVGLEQNLTALIEQEYPEYEIIFVVDSEDDASVGAIRKVMAARPIGSRLVVAPAANGCAQKIANLREGVLHADEKSEAFVFADSDARPGPGWLGALVAPLREPECGAATGYRWFVTERPAFAAEMRSVWNASIASALGPNRRSNFCWGGSTAMRRDVFDRIKMSDKWVGTLSDDFAVTRALRDAGLPITFVPQALSPSLESCTLSELLEFTNRQMRITRVYMPQLWAMSLFGSVVFNAFLVSASFIVIAGDRTGVPFGGAILSLALVAIFSIGKAWLRLKAVRLVLREYEHSLKRQTWPQYTLWLLSPMLFLINSVAALLSRRVKWRGIVYELKSPTETVIISH